LSFCVMKRVVKPRSQIGRAVGVGLVGERARRAIIVCTAMPIAVIVLFPESALRTEWQTAE